MPPTHAPISEFSLWGACILHLHVHAATYGTPVMMHTVDTSICMLMCSVLGVHWYAGITIIPAMMHSDA